MQLGGEVGNRRERPEDGGAGDLVGRAVERVAEAGEHLARLLHGVVDLSLVEGRPMRMRRVLERGHDAEVPAAAPKGPEEVGVLVLARAEVAPVGGDELAGDEVVDGHAVCSALVRVPAREREPGDARLRDDPAGDREAERLRLPVDVGPGAAALCPDGAPLGIHPDASHQREVDDDAVVAHTGARDVVAAAAHRHRQLVLAHEVHRGDDVGDAGTHDDEQRTLVDHPVPDPAGVVVLGVTARDDPSAQAGLEVGHERVVETRSVAS